MESPDYRPRPLDTDAVALPPELEALVERLAANSHEVWSAGRLRDGWTWGPRRNDDTRTHPCLVPYDQLPESEKAYDRSTVVAALKAIVLLGYRIEPPARRE